MQTTLPTYLRAVPSGNVRGTEDGNDHTLAKPGRMLCAVPTGFHAVTRPSHLDDDDFDELFDELDCVDANPGEVHRVARHIES